MKLIDLYEDDSNLNIDYVNRFENYLEKNISYFRLFDLYYKLNEEFNLSFLPTDNYLNISSTLAQKYSNEGNIKMYKRFMKEIKK